VIGTLTGRLQKASDQLLELLAPKATADAQPGQSCVNLGYCHPETLGCYFYDFLHDVPCGCSWHC
jgi:hypothetical protein